ncbi:MULTISPECIES: GerAB/ArcD/ProY family transporter [Bacillus]|uniref:GerAB/ArcD/ProY family transporter n=1 Tax=Bacillus TaxID=1386 RepID=UPI000BB6C25C|nr:MULTISPECIES: GerAB/ArcD/ProY family transporter [Bacillus]
MQKIPERFQISPFLVFFLLHAAQFGVGVLGYQRIIAMSAGHDAWMGIIIIGIYIHIIVWLIYSLLEKSGGGDLVQAHQFAFGKWFGNALSLLFALYFVATTITVLRTYIEVVQIWLFPDIKTWLFVLLFLFLVYYIVSGGFRIVTGIAFFGTILPSYLLITFVLPGEFMEFRNLLPIYDTTVKDLLLSAKDMSLTVIGFEALLVYYPYLKDPGKSKRWAHLSILTTNAIYLFIAIITFAYFSEKMLEKQIWATLTIWKIIELPFVERVEYIGIANWCLIILPNVCIFIWAGSRVAKRVANVKHRLTLIVLVLLIFGISLLFEDRKNIHILNDYVGKVGFYLVFAYIPFLFLVVSFVKWRKEKKKNVSS